MGAIEYRRFSLLGAGLLAAAMVWLLAQPAKVDAGNWKTQGRSWGSHDSHWHFDEDEDDYYDKDDSSCECDEDNENIDDTASGDCADPSNSDGDSAHDGGDATDEDPTDNGNDSEDDPGDPDAPADPGLELHIDQQVQVDGGAFVDAEDDTTAPEGQVGDPVVWQVTVGVDEAPVGEDRTVKITWDEPENVDVTGSEVTSGTFDGTTWTVGIGAMPATLTINSVLNGAGLGASTARISEISCDDSGDADADGFCDFEDNVNTNNTNPAGVVAMAEADEVDPGEPSQPAAPGVLGATTSNRGGAVLAARTGGRVLGRNDDRALAATGMNNFFTALIGGLLVLAPVAIRVRK